MDILAPKSGRSEWIAGEHQARSTSTYPRVGARAACCSFSQRWSRCRSLSSSSSSCRRRAACFRAWRRVCILPSPPCGRALLRPALLCSLFRRGGFWVLGWLELGGVKWGPQPRANTPSLSLVFTERLMASGIHPIFRQFASHPKHLHPFSPK